MSYHTYDGEIKQIDQSTRFEGPKELLAANIGKPVTLLLEEGEPISGMIESVHSLGTHYQLMLKVESVYRLVSSSQIIGFELGDQAIERRINQRTETTNFLKLQLENPQRRANIELTYLTNNLSWIPQYQAQILDDKRISLRLFATILNDRSSLENVRLNLAVGQPEFLFSRMNDPIFNRSTVREFLNQLNNGGQMATTAPMLTQNVITSQRASVMAQSDIQPTDNSLNEADLYFFNIHNFSLERGHTAKVRLLELDAEYSDVYTCNLNSRTGTGNTYRVNHAIRFRNSSEHPLTTGIVMFHTYNEQQGFEPLGQQQLDFIAPGALGQLRLGIATEIVVDQIEIIGEPIKDEERSRFYRDHTVTFSISNFKDESAKVQLRRTIQGYLLNSDIEAVVISNGILNQASSGRHFYDQRNNYEWTVDLDAGETQEISLQYRAWQ